MADLYSIKSVMRWVALCLTLALGPCRLGAAQQAAQNDAYECPMDHDVRSPAPGKCWRCGMALVPWVADPREYAVQLTTKPSAPKPGQRTRLFIEPLDSATGARVHNFKEVHTKLLHLFLVSADLQWFAHVHPAPAADHRFQLDLTLPKPGMYRVLADFYPAEGTPQLAPQTLILPGPAPAPALLTADLLPKDMANLHAELSADPPSPIAGQKTRLILRVTPAEGLEQYLGAWAHLLAASDDLIDMIHEHPWAATGPEVQFDLIFPRARPYRLWIQLQRHGVVNTAVFTVPVKNLD